MWFLILSCLIQPAFQLRIQGLDLSKPYFEYTEGQSVLQDETTKPVLTDVSPAPILRDKFTSKPGIREFSRQKLVLTSAEGQKLDLNSAEGQKQILMFAMDSVTTQYSVQPTENIMFDDEQKSENAVTNSALIKTTSAEEESLLGRRYHSPYRLLKNV